MNRSMLLVLLLGTVSWMGCGGGAPYSGTVIKGKVTVAGKGLLTGGTIQFVSVADSKAILVKHCFGVRSGTFTTVPEGTLTVGDAFSKMNEWVKTFYGA